MNLASWRCLELHPAPLSEPIAGGLDLDRVMQEIIIGLMKLVRDPDDPEANPRPTWMRKTRI